MTLPPGTQASNPADHRALYFAACRLPWLLGVLMLCVYGLTLNHWVTPASLPQVARLEDINWLPTLTGPVTFLITWPLRWLPAAWVPLALNLFSAVCAALSLGLLARSVVLLPHDLTENQLIKRKRNEAPKLLTSRQAWLPPLAAVLICGLQFSFWQNATVATTEMFNLLMFAYVIRCFLEYNADRNNAWLLRGALVYGLAVANDWAMAVFFPAFCLALIWIKKLFIFTERFLKRFVKHPRSFRRHLLWQIPGCWLAGLLIFLLLPTVASLSEAPHMDFWPALKLSLTTYKSTLTTFPKQLLITSCLISVMPVLVMGIRFCHFLAGSSRMNTILGTIFFQLSYGFLLLVCLWTMFDSPLSPRRLQLGQVALPMYFLGALSIGYFVGHFLLISGIQPEPSRRRRLSSRKERQRKQILRVTRWLKRSALTGMFGVALGVPTVLICKNLPGIALKRSDPCGDYIDQVVKSLPPDGAVIIGTDSSRLLYLQTALIREGRAADYLVLDTEAVLQHPDYLDFLKQRNPGFNVEMNPADPSGPGQEKKLLVMLLQQLAGAHPLYSLHPEPLADMTAEFFYAQPHELLYELKPYLAAAALAPPTPAAILQDNETFWRTFETGQLPGLIPLINLPFRPPPAGRLRLLKSFVNTLRFLPEPDHDAKLAGTYYAVALNDWGVTLQTYGHFPAARTCFDEALQLDPLNPPAQINQKFNADYLDHHEETVQRPLDTARGMNEYRDWRYVVRDGLVDEPNFCNMLGVFLTENRLFRPAIAQYLRVEQLTPGRPDTYLNLAKLFVECREYTNTLKVVDKYLALAPASPDGLYLKAIAYMHLNDYARAEPLLDQLVIETPTNNLALLNRGIARMNLGDTAGARRDFNAVIQIIANPTNALAAYYNLAKMDDQEQHPAAAITNYELFLKYAPPQLNEIPEVEARLKLLNPALHDPVP